MIRQVFPRSLTERLLDPETATHHLWSIGIYSGSSPYRLSPARGVRNPVLTRHDVTDARALFVADPFMVRCRDTWYMFFEVYNFDTAKGEIGLATSKDGLSWRYDQIVLREPFHLSYPYVFELNGRYYMIPESHQAQSIRLYESRVFPTEWYLSDVLLTGQRFSDNSIFHYADRWWLFSETDPELRHDTLRLYLSTDLHGPWHEHPASPVVRNNARIARPGGRVIVRGKRPIRFAQDCVPVYGTRLRAFELSDLSPVKYREAAVSKFPLLGPGYKKWNVGGMHHVDLHQIGPSRWIAAVDGWAPVWRLVPDEWQRSV